jgi:hypothetical protein
MQSTLMFIYFIHLTDFIVLNIGTVSNPGREFMALWWISAQQGIPMKPLIVYILKSVKCFDSLYQIYVLYIQ